jgi:hypothetical protein
MALNYKQKKNMKTYAVIAAVVIGAYLIATKVLPVKTFINSAAAKLGFGTAALPLIK